MTKLGKLLALTLTLLSMITTSYAATTDELLNACDRALNAKIQEASLCGLGVQLRTDEITRLRDENKDLREKGTSIWSNPFLWATIGLFIGSRVTR